ncbi:MAG: hypothetical protein LAE24_10595 [Candidatus Contendobacter sp.]|nr:hypothetical protein [Candidatus Contendobacter sp.]
MNQSPGFLNHVLGGITSFAQHHLAERRIHQERLAFLHQAIERVVDASEPRIRLIGNYPEKLADAVEIALHHSERVLQQLPAAVALDGHAWANDPQVNAFFATADEVRTTLSQDVPIQAFFAENRGTECFALLLMVKQEAETFGTVLEGEMLVREVRQIRVSFSHHRLFFPAASEAELRQELKQRMLVFLASRAQERINELRTGRGALEEQRRQLQAQLRAWRMQGQGLRSLLSSADVDERRLAKLEQRLIQTEEELVAARKQLGTLDDYLEQVARVLGQPETYLRVQPLSLRLNRLGLKLTENSSEPGETLSLIELVSLGEQRIGTLVRFGREESPRLNFSCG